MFVMICGNWISIFSFRDVRFSFFFALRFHSFGSLASSNVCMVNNIDVCSSMYMYCIMRWTNMNTFYVCAEKKWGCTDSGNQFEWYERKKKNDGFIGFRSANSYAVVLCKQNEYFFDGHLIALFGSDWDLCAQISSFFLNGKKDLRISCRTGASVKWVYFCQNYRTKESHILEYAMARRMNLLSGYGSYRFWLALRNVRMFKKTPSNIFTSFSLGVLFLVQFHGKVEPREIMLYFTPPFGQVHIDKVSVMK